MKWNKAAFVVIAFVFLVGFVSAALADSVEDFFGAKSDDFIKYRTYVGGFGLYTGIDSTNHVNGFNGNVFITSVASPKEIDLLPSISQNFGFGGLVGQREGPYALEVSYWRSSHNASWTDNITTYSGTASYQSLNVDFKRYLFTQVPTQPFFELGVSFPWLVFKDASSDQSGFIGDFSLSGVGINLGVGMEIYLGNGFSIMGSALQRWSGYTDMVGVQQQHTNFQLDGYKNLNVEGNGLNFLVGATMGFE
ncbi:MAG TPA: hypothetical protein VIJ93_01370 [bacterium]